jgi:hypothetical protein
MTIVFDDEELYTALKVEAARTHRTAKDIVAEALRAFFDGRQDWPAGAVSRPSPLRGSVDRLLEDLALKR